MSTAELTQEPERTPARVYEDFYVPAIFAPLAQAVLERAAPRPGERVLDVACGTGIVARQAARLVGPRGRVVAVDLNPGMLEVAGTLPLSPEGAPIEWREGDATGVDLPEASFDLVVCQQGLQFFPDPAAGLARMRRVVKPGGRVCVACWAPLERQQLLPSMTAAEARHLAPLGITFEELVAPFSLGDPERLATLLEGAGFAGVEIASHLVRARFPAEAFVERFEFAYGAVIPHFAENPQAFTAFVAAVERDVAPALARHREGDEIVFEMRTHIATARAG